MSNKNNAQNSSIDKENMVLNNAQNPFIGKLSLNNKYTI